MWCLGKRENIFPTNQEKVFQILSSRLKLYIFRRRGDLTIRNESQKFIEFQIAYYVFLLYICFYIYIYHIIHHHILNSHRNNRRKEKKKKKNINGLKQL